MYTIENKITKKVKKLRNQVPKRSRVQHATTAKEINLREIYFILRRRFWIILLFTSICTIFGAYVSSLSPLPLYQANTRILLSADSDASNNFIVMLKEPIVLDEVRKQLNLGYSTNALSNQINVSSVMNSNVISITVTNPSQEEAVEIADTTVQVYKETLRELFGWSDVKVLTDASTGLNPYPINPPSNRMLYVGIVVGLILGVGAALLRESLDDTIRGEKDVEKYLDMQVLGHVDKISKKDLKVKNNVNVAMAG